ncbi:MAG: transposase [Okeania sp. SIO3B5]|nr:transposase [Okeania sp. SIO3B5]
MSAIFNQQILEDKTQWYSSELVIVDRFFPSSKTCSNCGHVQDMPLNVRTYIMSG